MKLWLSKNSEVPLREQLTAQIVLGVVSNDLRPGQRLPSTRELARRFHIHANTVSAAYRELEQRGWLESRKGSGVYVRALGAGHEERLREQSPQLALDRLISSFLQAARDADFSLGDIQSRVRHWLTLQPPDHFLVIEPDEELRRILCAEIAETTGFPVRGASPEQCGQSGLPAGAAAVALYSQAERVRACLPPDTACIFLRSRSIPESLQGQARPAPDALVVVASRWPEFLRWSRTVLVAAGLDAEALDFRDARDPRWRRGLGRAPVLVIADALTARQVPAGCDVRVFRAVADESLAELRRFVEDFLPEGGSGERGKAKDERRKSG